MTFETELAALTEATSALVVQVSTRKVVLDAASDRAVAAATRAEAAASVLDGVGAPPVLYAAGISMTLATQTVEYLGVVYSPKVANLPFTTSGTFETTKFRLAQGITAAQLAQASTAAGVGIAGGSNLQAFIDQVNATFSFVAPTIPAFTIDGVSGTKIIEKGVSLSSVSLAWALSGSTPNAQTINNGVGTVPVGTLNKTVTGPFTTSQSFTLTVDDTAPNGDAKTVSATVNLSVQQKRYWGVSVSTSLDSAAILALGGSEFATAKNKSVTYDCTGGRYPYFAYPTSMGALSAVTVGGLGFTDFTTATVSFTNASGATENYYVTRFNTLQNGSAINVSWN